MTTGLYKHTYISVYKILTILKQYAVRYALSYVSYSTFSDFLDIIHYLVFFHLKRSFGNWTLPLSSCNRSIQLDSVVRACPYVIDPISEIGTSSIDWASQVDSVPEDGSIVQCPICCFK
jgi:hypothetical protein